MNRAQIVEKLIRGIYDSLQTHLDGCYKDTPEGKKFHRQCVIEYSELLQLATKLY